MEIFAQYLDELEDLIYAIALVRERIVRLLRVVLFWLFTVSLQALGIYVALVSPPLAVAVASILLVTLLYRGAVHRDRGLRAAA